MDGDKPEDYKLVDPNQENLVAAVSCKVNADMQHFFYFNNKKHFIAVSCV